MFVLILKRGPSVFLTKNDISHREKGEKEISL
jgi:hypothetical protein